MGFGINGYRCVNCRVEWNAQWCTITQQFPNYKCPKCHTEKITKLKQCVPYKLLSDRAEPNRHECICGYVFYKKPESFFFDQHFDFEKDKDRLAVECPRCGRSNIPPDGQAYYDMPLIPDQSEYLPECQFGEG